MNFGKIAKFVGIILFVLLAGYGALVTFYEFSPKKERPRVVIPLGDLSINFGAATDSKALTWNQDPAKKENSSDSLLQAGAADTGQQKNLRVTTSKVAFEGDLSGLNLTEKGMGGALPSAIEDQVLQASVAQKISKGENGLEEILNQIPKVDCERDKKALERYTNIGAGEEIAQYPINRIYDLRQKEKIGEINQIIEDYKKSIENNADVAPPDTMIFHYRVKLTLFEKLVQKLEEVRDAPKGKPLEEIYSPLEAKTHVFVMTLLEEVINSVCEKCNLNTAQCKS